MSTQKDAAQQPMPEVFPEIMTIEQAARYLQFHPQVVYRHVRAGTLPASRIGRTIRFKKSVLDAFLERDAWAAAGKFLAYVEAQRPSSAPPPQVTVTTATAGDVLHSPDPPRRRTQRFAVDVD